jgi:hypothetical protein
MLLAVLVWPFAAARLAGLDTSIAVFELNAARALADTQALLARWLRPLSAFETAWTSAQAWLSELAAALELGFSFRSLPLLETLLVAVVAALACAIATALLVRRPFANPLRRRP